MGSDSSKAGRRDADLSAASVAGEVDYSQMRVARRRKPLLWVVTAAALFCVARLVDSLLTNPNYQWSVVGHYFFSTDILQGLVRTLELTALSMGIGILLGVAAAIMRLSGTPVLSGISWAYTWFFRGTPLLVQIIFWYNLSALVQSVSLGIPFGPTLISGDVNAVITPFTAALLGLALNEGAYMAEIVRSGIMSVHPGQEEASAALGMTPARRMRRIILPQAMRIIIPPTGNQVISLLKSSSLVSVTSMPELLYSTQLIYERTFQTIPLLIVASIWYLIVTTLLSGVQFLIERRYSRGSSSRDSTRTGLGKWAKGLQGRKRSRVYREEATPS